MLAYFPMAYLSPPLTPPPPQQDDPLILILTEGIVIFSLRITSTDVHRERHGSLWGTHLGWLLGTIASFSFLLVATGRWGSHGWTKIKGHELKVIN